MNWPAPIVQPRAGLDGKTVPRSRAVVVAAMHRQTRTSLADDVSLATRRDGARPATRHTVRLAALAASASACSATVPQVRERRWRTGCAPPTAHEGRLRIADRGLANARMCSSIRNPQFAIADAKWKSTGGGRRCNGADGSAPGCGRIETAIACPAIAVSSGRGKALRCTARVRHECCTSAARTYVVQTAGIVRPCHGWDPPHGGGRRPGLAVSV